MMCNVDVNLVRSTPRGSLSNYSHGRLNKNLLERPTKDLRVRKPISLLGALVSVAMMGWDSI